MSSNIIRPRDIDVNIDVNIDVDGKYIKDLPAGWVHTHFEGTTEVDDVSGYYIISYESEHFLISQVYEHRESTENVHRVVLLKVKRGDNGERLTAIGTGIYKDIGISKDSPDFLDDIEEHRKAHKKAKRVADQVAYNMMKDVNSGKYKNKRYQESDSHD